MNVTIKVIPHSEQRYDTIGDWIPQENGDVEITVSEVGNWRYEMLVAFHELAEYLLCKARGITDEEVVAFDKKFGETNPNDEPGNSPDAPYRREHLFATGVELLLAEQLGVDLLSYDEAYKDY